jgi:hypothetical protein
MDAGEYTSEFLPDTLRPLADEADPWRLLDRLRDARVAELREMRDPYQLLTELARDRKFKPSRAAGIAYAMRFYSQFVVLLLGWPAADVEALLVAATSVFAVGRRQLRRDLTAYLAVGEAGVTSKRA